MSISLFDLALIDVAASRVGKLFAEAKLRESFDSRSWHRGQDYFIEGKVQKLISVQRDAEAITLLSDVSGSGRKTYDQQISAIEEGGHFLVNGYCACPVGHNCKHVAAALLELQARLMQSNGGAAKNWMEEVSRLLASDADPAKSDKAKKTPAKKTNKAPKTSHQLGFLIRERDDESLSIRLAKLQRSPNRREPKIETDYVKVRLSKPASYLEGEDMFRAWRILESLPNRNVEGGSYQSETIVDGEMAYEFFKDLLSTERVYLTEKVEPSTSRFYRSYADPRNLKGCVLRQKPLSWGGPETIEATWEQSAEGKAWKPVLQMSRPDLKLYRIGKHRIYLDKKHHEVGDLSLAEGLSEDLFNLWSMAPELSGEEAFELASNFPQAKLRPPVELLDVVEVTDRIPRPVLELKGEATLDLHQFEVSIRLLFDYGHGELVPYLGETDLPPIKYKKELDDRMVLEHIIRDSSIENGFCRSLENLDELERGFDIDEFDYEPEEFVVLYSEIDLPAAALLRLRDNLVPELKAAGWQVIDELVFPFNVVDASPEISLEQEGTGTDWFRFEIGLLGKQDEAAHIDLTELMASFLASHDDLPQVEDLPDPQVPIFLPHHASGTMLKLPCGPFLEVLHAVSDLLLRPHEPVHRLRAAGLAETMDMDDSETLRSLAELGKRLATISEIPEPALPQGLKAELRGYQREGFSWMQFLARHSLHGVLADDMGLGKTVQSLAHLVAEVESGATDGLPSLVVAPTSVVGNWMAETKKFTPKLKTLELQGPERKQWFDRLEEFDIVFTSYALINRDIDALREQSWHLLILDEAQHIKNATSKVSRNVCELGARHRLCLSGTPVENHLGELWTLYRFLMPGYLGNKESFRKNFQTPIERHDDGLSREGLARRVRPLILRRTKDEVVTELPPKTEIVHQIQLNKKQVNHYESVRLAMDSKVREAIAAKGEARSQIIFLEALLKLRQICCDPRLLEKGEDVAKAVDSAKFDFLIKDLLPTLVEDGRRILLFSQFTRMLGFIEDGIKELGIPYLKLTGASRKRGELVERFQAGEAPIFLISLKAGGTGLNLTEADTVIHYDPWWNPAAENQATDRAHRIGQEKPVFVHRLICEGTIESRIQDLQKRKAKIAAAILDGASKSVKLDQETLSALLAPL